MLTDTQTLLRRHLSQAFGLSALVLTMGACSDESRSFDDQACTFIDPAAECPTAEDAVELLEGNKICETPVREVVAVGEFVERLEFSGSDTGFYSGSSDPYSSCCYEVNYRELKNEFCVVGRPLMHEGRPITATVHNARVATGWSAAPQPVLAGLSLEQRAALREHWLEVSLLEHASVASFSRFALDLMAFGAPPELVFGAHNAAADEVVHARLSFALASAFAGEVLAPGRLALPNGIQIATSLAELARAAAIEGCIGETLAVVLAAEQLKGATDPAVRAALTQIIQDESKHAELAWATLRWALKSGDASVRRAIEEVFASPLEHCAFLDVEPVDGVAVPSHGLPSSKAMIQAGRMALERVVLPAAKLLLS